MPSDLHLRLQKVFEGKRLVDVARELGITVSKLSEWLNGKYEPNAASLRQLTQKYNFDLHWLLTGEERKMLNLTEYALPVAGVVNCGRFQLPDFTRTRDEENGAGQHVQVTKKEFGLGPLPKGNRFALMAEGDSMQTLIEPEDILIFKAGAFGKEDLKNGDVVCATFVGESTIKRYYFDKKADTIILRADNPRYQPIVYDIQRRRLLKFLEGEETGDLRLDGVLLSLHREKFYKWGG